MMEDKIKEMEQMLSKVKAEQCYNRVVSLLEKYNVIATDEEIEILYTYALQEKDIEWIIRYIEGNKNSLLKAIVSYHSDWSGSQGY